MIEIRGLTHRFSGAATAALDGVDLTVRPGERVALVGPNGAGKSTLVAHLDGALLARPPVVVCGLPVTAANLAQVRRKLGVVLQEADDQLFMPTVREDVAFGPFNQGLTDAEIDRRTDAALAAVGAADLADRLHHALSGGERRRVTIATVLAMQVDVLVLDEPTSNLDARGRRSVANVLRGLTCTLVVATHDLELVAQVCDRIVVLDAGRVVADAPAAELLADRALLERHGVI